MTGLFKPLGKFMVALVALLHTGFMIMEIFFWTHPVTLRAFDLTLELAENTGKLALNQGLYNGFLVAGLLWGLIAKKRDVQIFFLLCVIVAGIFGALTVKPTIFFVQAVPAIIALACVMLSRKTSV